MGKRIRKKALKTVGSMGALLLAAMLVGWKLGPQTGTPYKVVEVVDGDTFFIANRQPIRLYGLDAPELNYCYGAEAKNMLEKLILNKNVNFGEILSEGAGRRILAMVYVDGKLINEQLIRNGFVRYRGQGNTVTKTLKEAGVYAREHKLGIYGPKCYQVQPDDPECRIKGNIDHIKKTKAYYPPECKIYNSVEMELYLGDGWFCSESEAKKAGFVIAETCR